MTRTEKQAIRRYHSEYSLQFRADGCVWARPAVTRYHADVGWGVLCDRAGLARFLAHLRGAR